MVSGIENSGFESEFSDAKETPKVETPEIPETPETPETPTSFILINEEESFANLDRKTENAGLNQGKLFTLSFLITSFMTI